MITRLMRTLVLTSALHVSLGVLVTPTVAHAEVIDRIAAIVNDDIITLSDVYRLMPIYIQFTGIDPSRLTTDEELDALATEVLEFLIDARLLASSADERELAITESEIDQFVAQQYEAMGLTEAQFLLEMQRQGIEENDFREMIGAHLTRLRMVQLDVLSELSISDTEIDELIAQRYPDGLNETFLSTSHILVVTPRGSSADEVVAAETRARALWDELQQTGDFAGIASRENADGSRNTGGRLGTFRSTELDQDYVRAALALAPGEISEPVRSQFGFHIIRMDAVERRPLEDAEALRDQIYGELQAQYAEQRSDVYLERMRSQAYINVLITDFP
jgi:peptidyl-prolyl cis-trans isomerase SurA